MCVEERRGVVAGTFFSCRCGVRARGCENNGQANSSGWGWYQRAERAKFRRVVVDANGQVGRWETGGQAGRERQTMYRDNNNNIIASGGVLPSCTNSFKAAIHFGSSHRASANETTFGKMVRCSSFAGSPHPANICPALENPEPLQVLKRHVEDRDTACHRLSQHASTPQPLPSPWASLVCVCGIFLSSSIFAFTLASSVDIHKKSIV